MDQRGDKTGPRRIALRANRHGQCRLHEIEDLQHRRDWNAASLTLAEKACQVEAAGADLLLTCTNSMHKVAEEVQAAISIPLLHLVDATAARIKQAGMNQRRAARNQVHDGA